MPKVNSRKLLRKLDDALYRIEEALARRDAGAVSLAAEQMADRAERVGLHVLARLARDIRDIAAESGNLSAVADPMFDLRRTMERNRIVFASP